MDKHTSDPPIEDTKVAKIVKGQTTENQVLELFGAPQVSSKKAGKFLYTYTHRYRRAAPINACMAPGWSNETSDELTIIFDQATGKVQTYSLQRGEPKAPQAVPDPDEIQKPKPKAVPDPDELKDKK